MILLFGLFQLLSLKDSKIEILYKDDGKPRETILCVPPQGRVEVDYEIEEGEKNIEAPLKVEQPGFFRRNRILILRVAPGVKKMRIYIKFQDFSGVIQRDPGDDILRRIAVNGSDGKRWKMHKVKSSFNSSMFTGSGLKILTSKFLSAICV